VIALQRRGTNAGDFILAVCNFTPVVRENYRIGVPAAASYREILNSDSAMYGGSNTGNLGRVHVEGVPQHGQTQSISITLPPLGVLFFVPERSA
jgi:1,4-alpha-glucan branching enzyme